MVFSTSVDRWHARVEIVEWISCSSSVFCSHATRRNLAYLVRGICGLCTSHEAVQRTSPYYQFYVQYRLSRDLDRKNSDLRNDGLRKFHQTVRTSNNYPSIQRLPREVSLVVFNYVREGHVAS